MKALILATAIIMAPAVTAAQAGRQPWQAADRHCEPPKQPLGTGNSLATWQKPKDCPLSKDDEQVTMLITAANVVVIILLIAATTSIKWRVSW